MVRLIYTYVDRGGMCNKGKNPTRKGRIEAGNTYQIEALEPIYNLKHIWQGFELLKAKNISLNLAKQGWRNIKVVKETC